MAKSAQRKTIIVPEKLWRLIKTEAAKKGIAIYKEIEQKYDK